MSQAIKVNHFWNLETASEEGRKYSSRDEMKKKNRSLYNWMYSTSNVAEVCAHMNAKSRKTNWNLESVRAEALKYPTRTKFKSGNRAAYNWAVRNELLDEVFSHSVKTVYKKWTLTSVKEEALKYTRVSEFNKNSNGAYKWAVKNDCLNEITGHMERLLEWNLVSVSEVAKKYTSRTKFKKENRGAYQWASRNSKLDVVCSHMEDSKFTFQKNEPAILYYLEVTTGIYKIGITNRSVRERFYGDNDKIKVLAEVHYLNGADAVSREKEIMEEFKEFKYNGPKILKRGNTELFTKNIMGI